MCWASAFQARSQRDPPRRAHQAGTATLLFSSWSTRAARAKGGGIAGLACQGPGLVVGGRIPLTLGGRVAGRAAAHLLPGLVVTGLAADVEVDELRVVHLTHDAVL